MPLQLFMLHRVVPTSLFVRQLMSYSPCRKENGRKRRVKGKERTKRRTENCGSECGSRLLIGTSQLPAASQLAYAHLVCSFSSPSFLSPSTPVALSRPQYLFSSVTSVPASRFTSAISHLDTRRNVSGRWKRRRGRR